MDDQISRSRSRRLPDVPPGERRRRSPHGCPRTSSAPRKWLSSTPKHDVLYQAFGWTAPEWVHMPLLRNADKSKITKRKNPVSLELLPRRHGFLPEALLNYLGTMGWSIAGDRERFTLAEMVTAFSSADRVSLGGPVFDLVKLSSMNADYLRALDDAEIVRRLRAWRLSDEGLRALVPLVRERIQRLDEFVPLHGVLLLGRPRSPGSRSPRSCCPRAARPRRSPMPCWPSARPWTVTATSAPPASRRSRAPSPSRTAGPRKSCSCCCASQRRPARRRRRCSRRSWASGAS